MCTCIVACSDGLAPPIDKWQKAVNEQLDKIKKLEETYENELIIRKVRRSSKVYGKGDFENALWYNIDILRSCGFVTALLTLSSSSIIVDLYSASRSAYNALIVPLRRKKMSF